MPQSSHRHKHGSHHPHVTPHPHSMRHKSKRSAALVMAIFIGLVGLAIAGLAGGNSYWMAGSTALGLVGGALIGHGIDKSLQKDKDARGKR